MLRSNKATRNLAHGSRAFKDFSKRLASPFLDLLAPPFCRECGTSLPGSEGSLCSRCLKKVEWIESACARCGTPAANPPPLELPSAAGPHPSLEDLTSSCLPPCCGECRGLDLEFDLAAAGGPYRGVLRSVVLQYKFHKDLSALPLLKEALARAAKSPAVAPFLPAAGAIVPVPSHPLKRWWRGWDPAFSLARLLEGELSSTHRVPLLRLLKKIRWTPSQVSLQAEARCRNLRKAFRVQGSRKVPPLIILVDDVLTTGTTLSQCSLALKERGARRVVALAIARS